MSENATKVLGVNRNSPEKSENILPPLRVLFVCSTNTAVSPMAEGIFKKRIGHIPVSSAGINAMTGSPVSADAVKVCAAHGFDISNVRTTNIRDTPIDDSVLILASTSNVRDWMKRNYPQNMVFTINEYAGLYDNMNITDPYGDGFGGYVVSFMEIREAVERISVRLIADMDFEVDDNRQEMVDKAGLNQLKELMDEDKKPMMADDEFNRFQKLMDDGKKPGIDKVDMDGIQNVIQHENENMRAFYRMGKLVKEIDISKFRYLADLEQLNKTTDSIFNLDNFKVLIILNDGTNLTSWDDVEDRNEIMYVIEDLVDEMLLSERYRNLKSLKAIVALDISERINDLSGMFEGCEELVDLCGLEDWNLSNVVNLSGMFRDCRALEDVFSLAEWNISNVSNMAGMFEGCEALKDLSCLDEWDAGEVFDTSGIFKGCVSITEYPRWYGE
jgi:protein-tyrosine-phosphatase